MGARRSTQAANQALTPDAHSSLFPGVGWGPLAARRVDRKEKRLAGQGKEKNPRRYQKMEEAEQRKEKKKIVRK